MISSPDESGYDNNSSDDGFDATQNQSPVEVDPADPQNILPFTVCKNISKFTPKFTPHQQNNCAR